MARFDLLQTHRAGILALMVASKSDPALACVILSSMRLSLRLVLQRAKLLHNNPRDHLTLAGLGTVYLYALYVWRHDNSRDMGKTMAALDRGLGYAAMAANFTKKSA
jgi:ubiquinone biosynthesis protein COQ9